MGATNVWTAHKRYHYKGIQYYNMYLQSFLRDLGIIIAVQLDVRQSPSRIKVPCESRDVSFLFVLALTLSVLIFRSPGRHDAREGIL